MGCAMTMKVFRLEHEDGYGPYHNRTRLDNQELINELIYHNEDSRRPGAWKDCLTDQLLSLRNKYEGSEPVLFGFKTLRLLEEWFVDWVLKALKEAGYRIKVYTVAFEDTASSVYQTIFTNGVLDHVYI